MAAALQRLLAPDMQRIGSMLVLSVMLAREAAALTAALEKRLMRVVILAVAACTRAGATACERGRRRGSR